MINGLARFLGTDEQLEELDGTLKEYLDQSDPGIRGQFQQHTDGFKAWKQNVAAEAESAAKATAEQQAKDATPKDKDGDCDMAPPDKPSAAAADAL